MVITHTTSVLDTVATFPPRFASTATSKSLALNTLQSCFVSRHIALRSFCAIYVLHVYYLRQRRKYIIARVRLSVCLSVSKITQKRVHGFG